MPSSRIKVKQFNSRDEWQAGRRTIGGSDAAALIGKSPYMSNIDLWEIKTGRAKGADLSKNELVIYGQKAERHLRELFRLDHPELVVFYQADSIITNERYPFAHASIDGMLQRKEDCARGVLEIKTATIQSASQAAKWKDGIPVNYLVQCLWYMAVVEADFAIINAQLRWKTRYGDEYKEIRDYLIERKDHESDISYLMLKGETFWRYVEEDRRPPLIFEI